MLSIPDFRNESLIEFSFMREDIPTSGLIVNNGERLLLHLCRNYSGRVGKFGKTVTLHKLPKEQYIRRAWIRAISRKNWKPTSYTRVCSDHFMDGIGPNSVDRNKIPTENLPQREIITHQNNRQPRTRLQNVGNPIDALQHHS